MSYVLIESFGKGVDRRRLIENLAPGSLYQCIDAHLNRGGEIEKRKAFVQAATVDPVIGRIYPSLLKLNIVGGLVSGTIPDDIYDLVSTVPDSAYNYEPVSFTLVDGKPYHVLKSTDGGETAHFYDNALVTDLYVGRYAAGINDTLEDIIDSIMFNMYAKQEFSENKYTITRDGDNLVVEQQALNTKMDYLVTDDIGSIRIEVTQLAAAAQTTKHKLQFAFTLVGEIENAQANIRIDDNDYGVSGRPNPVPELVYTHKSKVYGAKDAILSFSCLNNPRFWSDNTAVEGLTGLQGSSFINIGTFADGMHKIYGLSQYQNDLAIFGADVIQIWNMNVDESLNQYQQTLYNTGTRAPRSIIPYGNIDVFYLAANGVRSLRTAAYNNIVNSEDVGSPVDAIVTPLIADFDDDDYKDMVSAIYEPTDGRYWLAIGDQITVLSFFKSSQVNGWSTYSPGFTIDDMAVVGRRTYLRSGADLYIYGGEDGGEYDGTLPDIIIPFVTSNKPADFKYVQGVALSGRGAWVVDLLLDPIDLTKTVSLGILDGFTFSDPSIMGLGHTTHIGVRFRGKDAGVGIISTMAVFFNPAESQT